MVITTKCITYCVSENTVWEKISIVYPMLLAITPILQFFAFTYNPNAYEKGFIYYYIPYMATLLSFLFNISINDERPYPQCLISYVHSINGLPCAEIVLTASFACVDIMYGGTYYYIAMQVVIILSMPTLSWYTFTAHLHQGFASVIFSTAFSILCFWFFGYLQKKWYRDYDREYEHLYNK